MKPLLALAAVLLCLQAQEAKVTPHGPQFPGPLRPASGPSWRVERDQVERRAGSQMPIACDEMDRWRREYLPSINTTARSTPGPSCNGRSATSSSRR